jgi:hypothetical protein
MPTDKPCVWSALCVKPRTALGFPLIYDSEQPFSVAAIINAPPFPPDTELCVYLAPV